MNNCGKICFNCVKFKLKNSYKAERRSNHADIWTLLSGILSWEKHVKTGKYSQTETYESNVDEEKLRKVICSY